MGVQGRVSNGQSGQLPSPQPSVARFGPRMSNTHGKKVHILFLLALLHLIGLLYVLLV
jgi:hypothetical protein